MLISDLQSFCFLFCAHLLQSSILHNQVVDPPGIFSHDVQKQCFRDPNISFVEIKCTACSICIRYKSVVCLSRQLNLSPLFLLSCRLCKSWFQRERSLVINSKWSFWRCGIGICSGWGDVGRRQVETWIKVFGVV